MDSGGGSGIGRWQMSQWEMETKVAQLQWVMTTTAVVQWTGGGGGAIRMCGIEIKVDGGGGDG
jgi:hypothetical protein